MQLAILLLHVVVILGTVRLVGWVFRKLGQPQVMVLNIGLDAGLVSPALFTILVLVAIATTLMTTPLLDWSYPPRLRPQEAF
jgi:Kef-type K+ transport system membrane component KefB